jgi:hypothetical protein
MSLQALESTELTLVMELMDAQYINPFDDYVIFYFLLIVIC